MISISIQIIIFLKYFKISLMEPKKDVSTAILDQKKAPNKLLVLVM